MGTAEITLAGDGNDAYYCFHGAATCAILKHRYKEIKSCLRFYVVPHYSLILVLHNLNSIVKETINEDGFCKHGDDYKKVC